ncbi:phage tail assembly chaperone [Pseudomonas sp. zfem004]|uniref:phage tail assembly chaperone n=1 Tax=Pseudomonas sp. zfem004 TaxID=3078199 RepID=UPI0029298D67|nr:tail fiber assembly protein [Pseudomonas sp. zfem004]MDU9402522.1 phage tail assembly chaperone [Pseudomonas sp. zfem004]
MYIYLIESSGALCGPVDVPNVPGIGLQLPGNAIALDEALAKPNAGQVWAKIDSQAPVQVEDRRGLYFRTDSGEQVNHFELGPLPRELTEMPRPDSLHFWDGQAWTLDTAAKAAHDAATERDWRDAQILGHEWFISRHRAERDLQRATTLSTERFNELLAYVQTLRDWPASEAFPSIDNRPVAPPWVAEYIQ